MTGGTLNTTISLIPAKRTLFCSAVVVEGCLGDEGKSTINGDGEEEDTLMFDVLVVYLC